MRFPKLLSLILIASLAISAVSAPLSASADVIAAQAAGEGDEAEASKTEIPDVSEYLQPLEAYSHSSEDSTEIETGSCGENVNYALYASGRLYIFGSGETSNYDVTEEAYSPFYKLHGMIREIIVEEGVTSIGDCLFAFLYLADNVSLPSSLQKIGKDAFISCNSILSVYVSEGVKEIGDYSLGFKVDNGRYGSFVRNSLSIIGEKGSAAEKYATDNEVDFLERSAKGKCGEKAFWVKDNLNGRITIFGSGPMDDYSSDAPMYKRSYDEKLTSVVVQDGITHVGSYLFDDDYYGQREAAEIILSDSVESVGKRAFGNLPNIPELHLSEGLKSIEESAFDLNMTESLYIPKGLSDLTNLLWGYYSPGSLKWIDVSPENESFVSKDGVLYSRSEETDGVILSFIPKKYPRHIVELPEKLAGMTSFDTESSEGRLTFSVPEKGELNEAHLNILFHMLNSGKKAVLIINGSKRGDDDFWSNVPQDACIVCDLTDKDWKALADSFDSKRNVSFVDLRDYYSVVDISAEKTELLRGEQTRLEAFDNENGVVPCEYTSSEPGIVEIKGSIVTALKAGETEVTATTADGKKSSPIKLTVTGESPEYSEYSLKPYETRALPKNFSINAMIPCEKLGGIYVYGHDEESYNSAFYFYSLNDSTLTAVQEFSNFSGNMNWTRNTLLNWFENKCELYDFETRIKKLTVESPKKYRINTASVDSLGRVYLACTSSENSSDNRLFLYSAEGELLDEAASPVNIFRFGGFNSSNGVFCMETYYNYYSWGYDHPGRGLTLGRVEDNKLVFEETSDAFLEQGIISRSFSCLLYLGQSYYRYHTRYIDMVGERYAVATSMTMNVLRVYDTSVGTEPMISLPNNDVENAEDENDGIDYVGVRTAYNESDDTLSIFTTNGGLADYDIKTGAVIGKRQTLQPVYDLISYGSGTIAAEKMTDGEDQYFTLEIFDRSEDSVKLTAQAEKKKMFVGESQRITVKADKDNKYDYYGTWSSSDENVVTVTDSGDVCSWRPGKATVTFDHHNGRNKASVEITVVDSEKIEDEKKIVSGGKAYISSNIHDQDYSTYGNVVKSYLVENDNSTFTRVEYGDKKIHLENYSYTMSLLSVKTLDEELPLFGGFFSGTKYNFVVYGQQNENQNDEQEVMRVIKYSKDWDRLASASVKGANTYIPFESGSLRMDETNGKLYIHTCHHMYEEDDGLHHQANMSYILDEEKMTFDESYFEVYNYSTGYVSHSFNQFVKTDGKSVFRADHGDNSFMVRGVGVSRISVGSSLTNVSAAALYTMNAYNYNDNITGLSIGGMELSQDKVITAINSVNQDVGENESIDLFGSRDVYVLVSDKNSFVTKLVKITSNGENVTCSTPQLVKLNSEQFLVMWEQSDEQKSYVGAAAIDSSGRVNATHLFGNMALSDCQPICASDGAVKWYVTDGESLTFYSISPFFEDGIGSSWENKIQYDLDGGEFEKLPKSSYLSEDPDFKLETPVRLGYDFVGWTGSCGDTPQKEVEVKTGSSGDLYYKAVWSRCEYSITYDLGEGTEDPGNPSSYNIDTETFTLKEPVRDDGIFLGWTTDGVEEPQKEVTIEKGSTGELSFKAEWKRTRFRITYDLVGGTEENNPESYTEETDDFTLNAPTRDGCIFLGWVGSNGTKAQKTVTVEKGTTGDLNFIAKWSQIEYSITYDLDGGVLLKDNPATYNVDSESFLLSKPQKDGYTFLGWIGSGIDSPQKNVSVQKGTTGDLHFTAVWQEGEQPQIDIKDMVTGILGDVNVDDNVDSSDALEILRSSIGLTEFTQLQKLLGDIDGDENITSFDALEVLRYSVGIIGNENIGILELSLEQ